MSSMSKILKELKKLKEAEQKVKPNIFEAAVLGTLKAPFKAVWHGGKVVAKTMLKNDIKHAKELAPMLINTTEGVTKGTVKFFLERIKKDKNGKYIGNDPSGIVEQITRVRMTKRGGLVAGTGVAMFGMAGTMQEEKHKKEQGPIEHGIVANMVNSNMSPTLDRKLRMLDNEDTHEMAMDSLQNSMNKSCSGNEADIVFALHDLRNGG